MATPNNTLEAVAPFANNASIESDALHLGTPSAETVCKF